MAALIPDDTAQRSLRFFGKQLLFNQFKARRQLQEQIQLEYDLEQFRAERRQTLQAVNRLKVRINRELDRLPQLRAQIGKMDVRDDAAQPESE